MPLGLTARVPLLLPCLLSFVLVAEAWRQVVHKAWHRDHHHIITPQARRGDHLDILAAPRHPLANSTGVLRPPLMVVGHQPVREEEVAHSSPKRRWLPPLTSLLHSGRERSVAEAELQSLHVARANATGAGVEKNSLPHGLGVHAPEVASRPHAYVVTAAVCVGIIMALGCGMTMLRAVVAYRAAHLAEEPVFSAARGSPGRLVKISSKGCDRILAASSGMDAGAMKEYVNKLPTDSSIQQTQHRGSALRTPEAFRLDALDAEVRKVRFASDA